MSWQQRNCCYPSCCCWNWLPNRYGHSQNRIHHHRDQIDCWHTPEIWMSWQQRNCCYPSCCCWNWLPNRYGHSQNRIHHHRDQIDCWHMPGIWKNRNYYCWKPNHSTCPRCRCDYSQSQNHHHRSRCWRWSKLVGWTAH